MALNLRDPSGNQNNGKLDDIDLSMLDDNINNYYGSSYNGGQGNTNSGSYGSSYNGGNYGSSYNGGNAGSSYNGGYGNSNNGNLGGSYGGINEFNSSLSMNNNFYSVERNKKSSSGTFVKVALILGVGIFLLLIGVCNLQQAKKFIRDSETTTAYVTKCERYTEHRRSGRRYRSYTRYRIYVSFEVNGRTYSGLYKKGASVSKYEGTPVTVYYNPRNPSKFNDGSTMTGGNLTLIIFGVIMTGFGGYLLILYRGDPDDVEYVLERMVKRR